MAADQSVRPSVAWLVAVVFTTLVGVQAIREELPEESRNWLEVRTWLPDWSFEEWTIAVLVVLLVLIFESSYRLHNAGRLLDYDPRQPKRYTSRTVRELFEMFGGKTTAETKATFAPHVGLWLAITGSVSDLDIRNDGWVVVTADFAIHPEGQLLAEPPKLVNLYFRGNDAHAVKSYRLGDPIKAVGRIHEQFDPFGGLNLVPSELSDVAVPPSLLGSADQGSRSAPRASSRKIRDALLPATCTGGFDEP